MNAPSLGPVVSERDFGAAAFGRVVMVEWRQKPTRRAVEEVSRLAEALIAAQPANIAFLVVSGRGVPPPDVEARDAFARCMRENRGRIAGAALAIEGAGLRSAAARAVATAISFLGGAGVMPPPCATVADAIERLTAILESSGEAIGAKALAEAFERLRQEPVRPPSRLEEATGAAGE